MCHIVADEMCVFLSSKDMMTENNGQGRLFDSDCFLSLSGISTRTSTQLADKVVERVHMVAPL